MTVIDTLTVNLQAPTVGMTKNLKTAETRVKTFASALNAPLAKLTGLFAGVFSVNAMKNFVLSGIDAADTIATIADELGTTAEAFNQLRHAAVVSDVSQEQLLGGFEKMEKTIGKAAQGSQSAADIFERLGIPLDALRAQKPDMQFKTLANAIAAIRDPSERAAAVVDVFGKSGMKLIPLLAQGAEGIDKLGNEVAGVFSEDNVKAIGDADTAIKQLTEAYKLLKTVIAQEIAPEVTKLADAVRGGGPSQVRRWVVGQLESARSLGNMVGGVGSQLMDLTGSRAAQTGAIFGRGQVQAEASRLLLNGGSSREIRDVIRLLEAQNRGQDRVTDLLRQILQDQIKAGQRVVLEGVEL